LLSLGLFVVWVAVAGASLLWGLDYYLLPPDERAYSPLAELFSPIGLVGHGLGIVGTAMIVMGVVGYALRKRLQGLSKLGTLKHWLQVHIFLCTLGPFLVLLHTTFKFGGIVSIAFWSMTAVVVSGIFGRYVYVRIPKTVNGRFLSMDAVRARAEELSSRLRAISGVPASEIEHLVGGWMTGSSGVLAPSGGLASALVTAMRDDARFRTQRRQIRRILRSRGVPHGLHGEVLAIAREQARTQQQATLMRPFQRLFGYWHVFHLPLAGLMFVILGVHVGVAILFGYTWIF
jgi:hypothetical protein